MPPAVSSKSRELHFNRSKQELLAALEVLRLKAAPRARGVGFAVVAFIACGPPPFVIVEFGESATSCGLGRVSREVAQ